MILKIRSWPPPADRNSNFRSAFNYKDALRVDRLGGWRAFCAKRRPEAENHPGSPIRACTRRGRVGCRDARPRTGQTVEAFREPAELLKEPGVGATRSRDASLAGSLIHLASCRSLLGREREADAVGEEVAFLCSLSEPAKDDFPNGDPFMVSTVLLPRGPDFYPQDLDGTIAICFLCEVR